MHHPPRTTYRASRRAAFHVATTLSLALASFAMGACGGDGGSDPDVGTPTRIELVGAAPTATVNALVTPSPSVKVSDAQGRAVPNVEVTFTANGGGTLTGATQRTNAQGVATVGGWQLGTTAGSGNTLVASAGTLTTTITATANAGAAAFHQAAPGQPASQSVQPSTTVAVAPAVRVTDMFGNPKQGVVVTFTPGTNSGTVTDGIRTTNAEGIATVGSWRVGSATGTQTLVASVAGNALPPVTFTANVGGGGGGPGTCPAIAYTLLASVNGTLATTDCPYGDGTYYDLYQFTTASAVDHDFRLRSSAFDAYLFAENANRGTIAGADDESSSSSDARLRLIAPPGTYHILANSIDEGGTGAYTLSSSGGARAAGCDEDTWVVPGASWSESLAASDCAEVNGAGTYGDLYLLALTPGRTATVTMRSTAVNSFIGVLRFTETGLVLVGTNDNGGGGNDAQFTFTAPSGDESLYAILTTTATAATPTGAYTMSVTSPTSIVAGARAIGARPSRVVPKLAAARVASWTASAPWGAALGRGAKAPRQD